MALAKKKILKEKGAAPDPFETSVAQVCLDFSFYSITIVA